MRRRVLPVLVFALGSALPRCVPNLGPGDALITSTRILAVRADPPEALPGTAITFTALVASPSGTVSDADIQFGFCTEAAPLTDENAVSSACLTSSSAVLSGETGPSVTAPTPSSGCSIFGPDTTSANETPRPPDGTGGYYQPLRLALAGTDNAFAFARIRCDLPDAPVAAATAFATQYTANQNPVLLPLSATVDGAAVALTAVPSGSQVILEASWPASSAETFAYYDPTSQTLTRQRESMQVAWYSSSGALDTEATGRASDDMATTTTDRWQAPGAPGTVHLWVVLRDSRGGVAFASYDVVVL